jgi:hypothetical protein
MSQSFFHLAPANDPLPPPSRGSLSYCANDDCASYTDEEHDAIMDEAKGLSEAFFDTIDVYSKTHPELSYDAILHAIDCLAYCINRQMQEDTADA